MANAAKCLEGEMGHRLNSRGGEIRVDAPSMDAGKYLHPHGLITWREALGGGSQESWKPSG